MQAPLLCSVSLFFLLVRVALKLRSLRILLRIRQPRLCRFAVFLLQTNVLSVCSAAFSVRPRPPLSVVHSSILNNQGVQKHRKQAVDLVKFRSEYGTS